MNVDPEQNPMKAAADLEAEAGKLEVRARQLRSRAAELKSIARAKASNENRLNEIREQDRKRKQVAAIQQRAVLEEDSEANRPNFIAEAFSSISESPALKSFLGLGIRLAFLGFVIFGFVVAYNVISDKKTNKQRSLEEENAVTAAQFGSLEDVLANANPRQLRFQSELRKDDPLKNDVQRIKEAKSRIAIAKRMLKLRSGDEEKAFANRSWAYSRLQLEVLQEKYESSNAQTRGELKKFLRERADDKDDRVRSIVVLGQGFLKVTELALFEDNVEQRDKESAMEAFKKALAVAENHEDSLILQNAAGLAYRRHASQTTFSFMKAFFEANKGSSDRKIQALVTSSERQLKLAERTLPAETEKTGNPTQNLIDNTRFTIDQKLASAILSEQECRDLVSRLTRVVQTGRAVDAKEMVDKVDEAFRDLPSVFEQPRKNVSALKLILSQLGDRFPGFALRTPNGDQFEFDPENPKTSFLTFVETDAVKEGYEQVLKLAAKSAKLLAAGEIQFVVVFLDPTTDESWIEIRQRELPENCFWVRVDKSSDAGRKFLEQFPILWSPFWIVLDQKLDIDVISPPEDAILSKIKRLSE